MAEPTGRFSIAFDDPTLEWAPTWTRIDDISSSLVASYTIDRGRQYEQDRTDTGRATVQINDRHGVLDPTNTFGPFYGKIRPLLQAAICRWNPVTESWWTRYRGFIEDFDYVFDPSQKLNRLTVSLVDLFEYLAAVEMLPFPLFGDNPADPLVNMPDSVGQVVYTNRTMQDLMEAVLENSHVPAGFYVVFTGNVECSTVVFSPGESPLDAIQQAADAEFPGVANVYVDRLGRLCAHGRLAKFDPVGTAATSGGQWVFNHWHAGDGQAVNAAPSAMAHLRRFAFNRGLSKVINSAYATPQYKLSDDGTKQLPVTFGSDTGDDDMSAQISQDTTSIDLYGHRSWSAENLITLRGLLGAGTTSLEETRRFADYYVQNYAEPRSRITDIGFRTMRPGPTAAAPLWALLSQVDIADQVDVTIGSPGGGGFDAEPYFVEGVHEDVTPLTPEYDNVTLTLDLSPQAFFTTNPWEDT